METDIRTIINNGFTLIGTVLAIGVFIVWWFLYDIAKHLRGIRDELREIKRKS